MGLTFEEAYRHTNPEDTDEKRKVSADALVAGSTANDVYWNHCDPVTRLIAKYDGHGRVASDYYPGTSPVVIETGSDEPEIVNGEPVEQIAENTNSVNVVAKLRAQLAELGAQPVA